MKRSRFFKKIERYFRNNKKNLKYFVFLFILTILLKSFTLNLPYHWDENIYTFWAKWFSINGFFSDPPNYDGHVPLFLWILALNYRIFGESNFLSHIITVIFSVIGLYSVYLLGKLLYNERVGIIASIITLFSPIYFSMSGQTLLDIPLTALTLATLYFALKKNTIFYLISACLLVLTKEPGILVVLSLALYQFIIKKNLKEKIKYVIIFSLPLLALIGWTLYYRVQTGKFGYFGSGYITFLSHYYPGISMLLKKGAAILYQLFVWNYHWLLIIIIIRFLKFPINRKIIPLFLMIFIFIIFFSFGPLLPRYLLPVYPLFFIICAYYLTFFKKKTWVILALIILLFVSSYRYNYGIKGFIQDPVFHSTIFYPKILASVGNGELSLDYIDVVEIEKNTLDFIFKNHKNSKITTAIPLISPWNINILDTGYRQWNKNNITILLCPVNSLTGWVKDNKTVYIDNKNLTENDLFIIESYSPQYEEIIDQFSEEISQMQIVKKFEINEKRAIIYRRP